MAPTRFLNLISVAALSLLAITLPSSAGAISLQSNHVVRSHHDVAAARSVGKRATNAKRCKPRSSSAVLASSTSTKKPSTTTAKATTTSTKKAAAATTTHKSTSVSTGGGVQLRGKSCLAWPNGNWNEISTWKGTTVGLIYTWDANKPDGIDELGFTYAPMLWGWKDVANFKAKTVAGYAKLALGCNEPNEVGQSNMDAWSGIALWRQYMIPLLDKGYELISPAMSSRPNGKDWMATFMANCGDDCGVSGIATHWYGTDLAEFKNYVTYWHTTYNLPVYVTEYADQDFNGGPQASMDEIWAFMVGATQWLNSQSWVKAHCWFGAMEGMSNVNPLNTLMNSAGTGPNSLGAYFIAN